MLLHVSVWAPEEIQVRRGMSCRKLVLFCFSLIFRWFSLSTHSAGKILLANYLFSCLLISWDEWSLSARPITAHQIPSTFFFVCKLLHLKEVHIHVNFLAGNLSAPVEVTKVFKLFRIKTSAQSAKRYWGTSSVLTHNLQTIHVFHKKFLLVSWTLLVNKSL